MASVSIQFERHDNLDKFDAIFSEIALPEVAAVCEQGVGMAQQRSPIDQGFFRNSITNEVTETSPGLITGQVFSTADPVVVNVIENGRSPGRFAPPAIIQAWVARKLAPVAKDLRSLAFLVNRKIATEGIPGRFVFKNTFNDLQPLIEQMKENVAAKVASRL